MKLSKDKILRRMGFHAKKGSVTLAISRLIDEETALARKLIIPKKIVRCDDIARQVGSQILLQCGYLISSSHIAALLRDAQEVCGFAVTIGKQLEEKRDLYLASKEETRALILDSIGSVAVEELAEQTHQETRAAASERNEKVTKRFSPGYGDWMLENQASFLEWLNAGKIHIKLTNNFVMIPEKSISAIVGIIDGKRTI